MQAHEMTPRSPSWLALVLALLGLIAITGGALAGDFAETAANGSAL